MRPPRQSAPHSYDLAAMPDSVFVRRVGDAHNHRNPGAGQPAGLFDQRQADVVGQVWRLTRRAQDEDSMNPAADQVFDEPLQAFLIQARSRSRGVTMAVMTPRSG